MKVVHVGFPKTAATFIQRVVFTRLPSTFVYFDKEASAPFFTALANHDDSLFDSAQAKRDVERAWSAREHALFSYEPLTGLHHQSAFVNRTLIATRLRDLGFERIIITIRNQFDALESAYKQYVRSGGVLKFDAYVTFDSTQPRYLYPEYFDYFRAFRLYSGIFGQRNVLVLQYEDLRNKSFLEDISRFLEIGPLEVPVKDRINPSLSYDKTRILRVINHMTYNSFRPSHLISRKISTAFFDRRLSALPFLNGRKSFFSTEKRTSVASFYRESNQRLQDEAKIRLAPEYP